MENEVYLFGNKKSRWYQVSALHATEKALEDGFTRILIKQPTGTGKTLTSGLIFSSERVKTALNVKNRPLKLLFIAHKHRLLTQAEREYAGVNNIEFISHSAFQDIPNDLEWDIACIDECHHEAMITLQYRLDKLGDKPIIGLTATPDRADKLLIKFQIIVDPISREDAVTQGFLAKTYINSIVDSPAKNKTDITKSIINDFGSEFGQTMIFLRTKKEVEEVTNHLISKGYQAVGILNQNDTELNTILDEFSVGKHQFIVNCDRISEGVDVKGCTDVFLARQFGSYPQINQVIGRASRPDSICVVWEFINPISGKNLDTTVVVGTPERHRLISRKNGIWREQEFNYVSDYEHKTWGAFI